MKVQNKFKKTVKHFGLSYVSKLKPLKILRMLAEGDPQSEISKKTRFQKSVVNYWTKKFLSDKLIMIIGNGSPKLYELTAFGSKILTTSERGYCEPIIMEDYPMKFRLISEHGNIVWEKLGEPKNWIKMGLSFCGIRVEKNLGKQPTIIIHAGQLRGFNPDELLVEAGYIIQAVRARLCDMKLIIDEVGVPIHRPIFKIYSPEAEELNRHGTIKTKDGTIDHSQPDSIPHEERGYQQQIDYLAMPRRVRQLRKSVEELKTEQLGLKSDMADLVSAVRSLVDVEKNNSKELIAVFKDLSTSHNRDSQNGDFMVV